MKKYMNAKTLIGGGLVLAAIITIFFAFFENANDGMSTSGAAAVPGNSPYDSIIAQSALGRIDIQPLAATQLGIDRNSSFLVSSLFTDLILTEGYLRRYLSVTDDKEFVLTEEQGDFLLEFTDEMTPGRIYNIVYSPVDMMPTSFAFQTVDIMRVVGTTPANSSHGVPTNTGIEITFSQPLAAAEDFENAFTIDPFVEGHFLQRENTYIFVPDRLSFNTIYTVTIGGGLESVMGDIMSAEHTFSFMTEWGTATGPPLSIAGSVYETFLPWREVFIDLNVSQNFPHRDFYVRLYDLQTPENFINGYNPGVLVDTFELELTTLGTEHMPFHYLFLNETLPVGYYLATISAVNDGNITVYKFIQVSALSVYSLSIAGETVFWIHDAATGEPAVGASISIDNEHQATTDHEGIAIANTYHTATSLITINYSNYLPFVYTKRTFATANLIATDRFLTYMRTDRPTYRPSDTVDVFGIIMPRYGHSHLPTDVITLRFGDMLELPINLDNHNTFNMRVPIENMFGDMDLVVNINGERLMSTWVNFRDYTNLSFVLEGQLDRNAFFADQEAHVEIYVTNFAGFVQEGVELTTWVGSNQLGIVSQEDGIARGIVPIDFSNGTNWQPFFSGFWFSVASDASISQHIELPFIVATRDIMVEIEHIDEATIELTASHIVLDTFNAAPVQELSGMAWDLDNFRGSLVDVDFEIEIARLETIRTIASQFYDHINSRMITTYNFDTNREIYRIVPGRTEGGRAVVSELPYSDDPLITYHITVRYNDSRGLPTETFAQNLWPMFEPSPSSIRHFGLTLATRELGQPFTFGGWTPPRDLGVGQVTDVILMEDNVMWNPFWHNPDTVTTPTTGRLLVVLAREGILYTAIGSPMGTPITFPAGAISSALVFGAYFDSGYIFPVPNPLTINYDYAEMDLAIEMDFDQLSYSPGDLVSVAIYTADSEGRPVPAQVVISVVDESAIVGWDDHDAYLLSRLYTSSPIRMWEFDFEQFGSHIQHNFGGGLGGAEGGGGGDGPPDITFRELFIDNPVFEVVQTDNQGRGYISFTLPDQITSWRVTALGVDMYGLAGDARHNIISSLPFAVDLILTNEYILGDDIGAMARVTTDHPLPVDFTFYILHDGDTVATYTQTTTTGRAFFNGGPLDIGSYIMRVHATMGSYTDGVELPFVVEQTGMIVPVRMAGQFDMGQYLSTDFHMRNFPVQLTLINGNIMPLTNIMHSVFSGGSFRTDVMVANGIINDFFWETNIENEDFAADIRSRIHAGSGGIGELIYADPDLSYTARFAAAFPEFVVPSHIIRYVAQEMEQGANAQRRAAGLLALAAVGEPVLLDINREVELVLAEDLYNSFDYRMASLYLVSALIVVGAHTSGYTLMNQVQGYFDPATLVDPHPQGERVTTQKFFINTTINPTEAWNYVSDSSRENRFVSDVPERINFVRRAIILGETVSTVAFYLNGQEQEAVLSNFDRKTLHITMEQFENLQLRSVEGLVDYFISFYSYGYQNWNQDEDVIEITRTIVPTEGLYRTDITVSLPAGYYGSFSIHDRMPSNMRHIPMNPSGWQGRAWNNWYSVNNTQRQLIEITFFQDTTHARTRTFSYYSMELFQATTASDITVVSNQNPENHIWGAIR
ncbi:MAG: Ig-like domain-containing protein [Defluviitaleaceae bacterium]|nr:Ig-like domain-containing protein [Defluviitaleaceae bacterium]